MKPRGLTVFGFSRSLGLSFLFALATLATTVDVFFLLMEEFPWPNATLWFDIGFFLTNSGVKVVESGFESRFSI